MAQKVQILTPENISLEYEVAGLGTRSIAMIIDTLIQSLVIILLLIVFGFLINSQNVFPQMERALRIFDSGWVIAFFIFLIYLVYQGYFLLFEALTVGQTPGKKAMGIRVILDDGHALDFRGSVIRNLLRIADILPSFYFLGIVVAFVNKNSKRIGDYAAGTVVVKVRPRTDVDFKPREVFTSRLNLNTQQKAAALPAESLQPVRQILERAPELPPEITDKFSREIAERLSAQLDDSLEQSGLAPLVYLSEVLAVWDNRN